MKKPIENPAPAATNNAELHNTPEEVQRREVEEEKARKKAEKEKAKAIALNSTPVGLTERKR